MKLYKVGDWVVYKEKRYKIYAVIGKTYYTYLLDIDDETAIGVSHFEVKLTC